MPFTDEAKRIMLEALIEDNGALLAVGREDQSSPAYPLEELWLSEDEEGLTNAQDIQFGRAPADEEAPLTHWLVFNGANELLAYDRLERPILLRKGERATFPAGSLRLELR